MKKPRVLYVYRTRRKQILEDWQREKGPDSQLFGLNHLRRMGYRVDFFDYAYFLFNPWHWLFYPFEHAIINQLGMGFKLDQAVTLLPKVKNYDVIVLTGDSAGLPWLWLKHLGVIKKPIIYLSASLAGFLKDNQQSWVYRFYQKFFPVVDILTCYAEVERDFFVNQLGVPTERVRYIPYGTDWDFFSKRSKRKRTIIVASGIDATRDYASLFEAVRDLPVKVEVACHPSNIKGLAVPDNVRVRILIPYVKVRDMFRRAKVAIVPLRDLGRGGGHMVTLETLSAGCPVVVSEIRGMKTAFNLKHEQQVLYTKPGDAKDIRRKIKYLLDHPKEALAMGKRGSQLVRQNYTSKHLAENVARFIEELV